MKNAFARIATLILIGTAALLATACRKSEEKGETRNVAPITLTVFAAASTTDVITEAAKGFEASGAAKVRVNFAASSTLARQIDSGAKADVYISANRKWMKWLEDKGHVDPAMARPFLRNTLVLIAGSETDAKPVDLGAAGFDLPAFVKGRLSVGDPEHVPAGIYAKQSLTNLGWWDVLAERLAPAPDVRSALRAVELGQTDYGIVYATDAARSDKVRVIGTFPASSHPPIQYWAAPLKAGDNQGAAKFLEYLTTPAIRATFEKAGFVVENGKASGS